MEGSFVADDGDQARGAITCVSRRVDRRMIAAKARRKIPTRTIGAESDRGVSVVASVDVAGRDVPPPEPLVGDVLPATCLFVMLAEQMTRAPPPLAEPLHWLIRTPWDEGFVPEAVHSRRTRVPPLAEPLHWVIVALVVVAGKGSQLFAMPSPEPTHWLIVAAFAPVLRPTKLLMTWTLQRSVPPPPLIELLHCVTAVTGRVRLVVFVVQAAVGSPAAP